MPKLSDLPPEPTILPLPKEERGSRGKPEKPNKPKAQTQPRTGRKQRTPTPSPSALDEYAQSLRDQTVAQFNTVYGEPNLIRMHDTDGELLERDPETDVHEQPQSRARPHETGQWGGPAKGPGYGGPAKGASEFVWPKPSKPLSFTDFPEEAKRMYGVWHEIAHDPEQPPGARVIAAGKFVEHVQGKAIERRMDTPNGETVDEVRIVDASSLSPEERAVLRKVLQEKLAERAPKAIGEP